MRIPAELLRTHLDKTRMVKTLMAQQYDVAHGSDYVVDDVRKSIRAGHPVYLCLKGEYVCAVGESADSIVVARERALYTIPDAVLRKAWNGDAVFILGEKKPDTGMSLIKSDTRELSTMPVHENMAEPDKRAPDAAISDEMILFAPERDTWDEANESDKQIGRRLIRNMIDRLDYYELPPHPVLVLFKRPSEEFKRNGIRAANNWVEIIICDPSDVSSEFAHELGHIYYHTRLDEAEKAVFEQLKSELPADPKKRPPIFTASWEVHDGEEVFATVYMWYVRGRGRHEGYARILSYYYPAGYKALQNVLQRVQSTCAREYLQHAIAQKRRDSWLALASRVAVWYNNLNDRPTVSRIHRRGGSYILKGRIPTRALPEAIHVPADITETLGEDSSRCWVRVREGVLNGAILVLRKADGTLDTDYMESHRRYMCIPVRRPVLVKGRVCQRTQYVHPDKLAAVALSGHSQPMSPAAAPQSDTPGALRRFFKKAASQLRIGIQVEKEHTSDPAVAKKIAKDHLKEFSDYYVRLTEMEKQAKDDASLAKDSVHRKVMKWLSTTPQPTPAQLEAQAQKWQVTTELLGKIVLALAKDRARMSRGVL